MMKRMDMATYFNRENQEERFARMEKRIVELETENEVYEREKKEVIDTISTELL